MVVKVAENVRELFDSVFNKSIRVFLVVCRTRSFTAAAKELSVTQSAVSQTICALEQRLSIDLFDRTMHPLSLTKEAEYLREELQLHVNDISAAIETIRTKSFIRPIFRVGIVESLAYSAAPNLVKGLLDCGKRVDLHTGTSDYLYDKLLSNQLDVIVASSRHSGAVDLDQRFLFSEPHVIVIPKTIARHSEKWTWEDLNFCGLPLIRYTSNTASGVQTEMLLAQAHLKLPNQFSVDDNRIVFDLVKARMGWSLTQPLCALQLAPMQECIDVRPAPEPCADREIFVVRRKETPAMLLEDLGRVTRKVLSEEIIPRITQQMPWVANQLQIGNETLTSREQVQV